MKRAPRAKASRPKARRGAPAADLSAIPSHLTPREEKAAIAAVRRGAPHPVFDDDALERIARAFDAFDSTIVARSPERTRVDVHGWNAGAALTRRATFVRASARVFGAHVDPAHDVRATSLDDVAAFVAARWAADPRDAWPLHDVELPRVAALAADAQRRTSGRVGVVGELTPAARATLDAVRTDEEAIFGRLLAVARDACGTSGARPTLRFVYAHGVELDGLGYIAFDLRHPDAPQGISVLFHGARLVDVGDHVAAWTWTRSRADEERARGLSREARAQLPRLPKDAPPGPSDERFPAFRIAPSDDGFALEFDDALDAPGRAALERLETHPDAVEAALVDAVHAYLVEADPELERDTLFERLRLRRVSVAARSEEGLAITVFWLDVPWETDEGLTVAMHGERVVAIGYGAAAHAVGVAQTTGPRRADVRSSGRRTPRARSSRS